MGPGEEWVNSATEEGEPGKTRLWGGAVAVLIEEILWWFHLVVQNQESKITAGRELSLYFFFCYVKIYVQTSISYIFLYKFSVETLLMW